MSQISYRFAMARNFLFRASLPFIVAALVAGFLGCASTPAAQGSAQSNSSPQWVNDLFGAYPDSQYIAAIGYGTTRVNAERFALGALVSIFGQSVQADIHATYRYSEAVALGVFEGMESVEIQNAVRTTASHDDIIGAEIRDTWYNEREKTYYAVAVIERLRASLIYSGLIADNEDLIQRLITIPPAERNSFEAVTRYAKAAIVADANDVFINILAVLSPASAALHREERRRGASLRLEAAEICSNIPIALELDQDRAGRVQAAFAQVFADQGMRTVSGQGQGNSRYALEVTLSLTETELPGNQNKWVRYVVDARFRDRTRNQVLFPFNINGREGHVTLMEAENRAIRTIEGQILDTFAQSLRQYLLLAL